LREGRNRIDLTFLTVLHDDVIELWLAGKLIYTARLMLRRPFPFVPLRAKLFDGNSGASWCGWPVRAADRETIMDPTTLQPVKDAFTLFREGLAAVRDAKALLPAAQQEAITITLEKAGTAASLAEAQIAKALGFRLHECTWPPQIMLAVKTPNGEEKRCPACGATTDIRTRRRVVRSGGAISTEHGDRSPENKPGR
jgi:hypothetical protein